MQSISPLSQLGHFAIAYLPLLSRLVLEVGLMLGQVQTNTTKRKSVVIWRTKAKACWANKSEGGVAFDVQSVQHLSVQNLRKRVDSPALITCKITSQ